MRSCIIVTGLTATGKTRFAYDLAKRENGVLINADSMQVYKYMDIGTNKERFTDIETKLIDIVAPDEEFSLYSYKTLAEEEIKKVFELDKLPIIVGGTPLYIYSLVKHYNLSTTQVNTKLREKLQDRDVSSLQDMLQSLNRGRLDNMNNSDRNNPRRLIRAIEVSMNTKEHNIGYNKEDADWYYEVFAPQFDQEILKKSIETRVEKMFALGLVDENKKLLDMGYSYKLTSMQAIGYKEFEGYFTGDKNLDQVKNDIMKNTSEFARKQYIWFKKDKNIQWVKGI